MCIKYVYSHICIQTGAGRIDQHSQKLCLYTCEYVDIYISNIRIYIYASTLASVEPVNILKSYLTPKEIDIHKYVDIFISNTYICIYVSILMLAEPVNILKSDLYTHMNM